MLAAMAAALLLPACGTDVFGLLERQNQMAWQAEPLILAAEADSNGIEEQIYAAEAERDAACTEINAAAVKRFNRADIPPLDQFWADLQRWFVYVVPVPSVEACADAQTAFEQILAEVCQDLNGRAGAVDCTPVLEDAHAL